LANVPPSHRRRLLALPTLRCVWGGMPEVDSADCGGLALKVVCGLLAVGHQYPDAIGGTLVGR